MISVLLSVTFHLNDHVIDCNFEIWNTDLCLPIRLAIDMRFGIRTCACPSDW